MSSNFDAAVNMAAELLSEYAANYGEAPFPTIMGKLMSLVENRATVDRIFVKRFKEKMHPIVGQMRRIVEADGPYLPESESGIIYLCPSLDLDWQRFVTIKEASHLLLDSPEDYVHDATDIDRLMVCLAQFGAQDATKQYVSEQRATVCAIELLFPKVTRDQLLAVYQDGRRSASEIAKAARVPAQYVRVAMGEGYREMIDPSYMRREERAAQPTFRVVGK